MPGALLFSCNRIETAVLLLVFLQIFSKCSPISLCSTIRDSRVIDQALRSEDHVSNVTAL